MRAIPVRCVAASRLEFLVSQKKHSADALKKIVKNLQKKKLRKEKKERNEFHDKHN